MKKWNYYYFIAGFLAILFSITHELNGQQTIIPKLHSEKVDIDTIVTFQYIWHIITAENFIFGIAFFIMSFYKEIKNVRFAAWLICIILIIRLLVIVSTTLTMKRDQISHLIIDIIAITVYIIIILLGTKEKR